MGASGASSAATIRVVHDAREPGAMVVRLSGRIERTDVGRLAERAAEALGRRRGSTVVCDVRGLRDPDAVAVEAICRIRLVGRRNGCEIVLRGASERLLGLIELLGLCDAFPHAAGRPSGVQPRG